MSEFKKGDRYRITIEGEWRGAYVISRAQLAGLLRDSAFAPDETDEVTVEKIVEPFKPGDFVRHKMGGHIYYLGHDGYVQVQPGPGSHHFYEGCTTDHLFPADEFERVEFVEKPF